MRVKPSNADVVGDQTWSSLAFVALNAILCSMVLLAVFLAVGAANLAYADEDLAVVLGVVVCSLFVGMAGLGLLFQLHFGSRLLLAREAELLKRFPDRPWMLNPEWAQGRLSDPQIGRVIFTVLFFIGWVGGIAFVGTVNFDKIMLELRSSPAAWAAAAFFTLITASIINIWLKLAVSWATLGNGVLRLESLPGRIGGKLTAKLETRLRRRPMSGLHVELTCLRKEARPAQGRRDIDFEQVWSHTSIVVPAKMAKGRQGLVIPICLEIEDGLPESDYLGGTVVWRLSVFSVGRIDRAVFLSWPVPIYRQQR